MKEQLYQVLVLFFVFDKLDSSWLMILFVYVKLCDNIILWIYF